MKFIVALIGLALFFTLALFDAAKGITYSQDSQSLVAAPAEPANIQDLTVAQAAKEENAGIAL